MVPPKDFIDLPSPEELTLDITPASRFQLININEEVTARAEHFEAFRKTLYYSYHTTAGYLEQSLSSRLQSEESVAGFVRTFRKLFPPEADYRHDQLELRNELTDEQKLVEPKNADSHLTYIGCGLESCVTYRNQPDRPVYLVELDGVNGSESRKRKTTVVGYNHESIADQKVIQIPMSNHELDSINLRNERYGFFQELNETIRRLGIEKGRVDIALGSAEKNAGLTVNEYETLLMTHDLMEVLHNPMRFMARKGYNMLRHPKAIPNKAKNYAKYDLVQVANEFIDATGLSESVVERIINKFIAYPAQRFLRMKRGISLLVSDADSSGQGEIVHGTYQSPILVQWRKAEPQHRTVNVTFVRFE